MIKASVPSEHRHDTRECSRGSRFSEQIRQLVLSRNVDHRNDRPLDQVLNDHKPQLKVLRPITKFPRIIGKLPRGSVVFISPNRVRRKPGSCAQAGNPLAPFAWIDFQQKIKRLSGNAFCCHEGRDLEARALKGGIPRALHMSRRSAQKAACFSTPSSGAKLPGIADRPLDPVAMQW